MVDANLSDEEIPHLKSEKFDQMFILVNFEEDKKSIESKANDDRAIVRVEWLEMILRLSLLKCKF